jgi:HD-like signal output (HDOD) protein
MTRILLVGAEDATAGTARALRSHDADWEVERSDGMAANGGPADERWDVVIAEPPLSAGTVGALLSALAVEHPETVRILLGGNVEPKDVVDAIPLAHQFLGRAYEASDMVALVERTLALEARLTRPDLSAFLERHPLPEPPPLYGRLWDSIRRGRVSNADLTQIVIQDAWLVSELLRVVNTTFFDRSSPVTDPREVVRILGTTTLQALVLHVELFRAFDRAADAGCDLEAMQRHARVAADLAVRIADGRNWWNQARTTALLHDLGELVLAALIGREYTEARADALGAGRPLCEVELERFGVTHAEVGAYAAARWGLPWTIVEPVATHHDRDASWHADPLDVRHAVMFVEGLLEEDPGAHGPSPTAFEQAFERHGPGRLEAWREAVSWVRAEVSGEAATTPASDASRRAG